MRQAFVPNGQELPGASAKTFSPAISALGTIWTSGCTAVRFDTASNRMVVQGNLVEQAGIALNKIKDALAAGDLPLANVTALVQYVAPAAVGEMQQLAAFYETQFAGRVPLVNTVVVKRLLRETALIEIEAIATSAPEAVMEYLPAISGTDADTARERVDRLLVERDLARSDVASAMEFLRADRAPGMRTGPLNEDHLQIVMPRMTDADAGTQIQVTVRRSDRVLVMSAYGDPAAGGVVEQCRGIYANLRNRLEQAGGLDAVVKTKEFITPDALAEYKGTAEIRRQIFATPFPAATGVVCERLGKPRSQIAVEVIAVSKPT